MNVRKLLKEGKKVRMKSWWWGRYVVKVESRYRFEDGSFCSPNHIPTCDYDDKWEEYNEEAHGKHNRDPIDAKYEDEYIKSVRGL